MDRLGGVSYDVGGSCAPLIVQQGSVCIEAYRDDLQFGHYSRRMDRWSPHPNPYARGAKPGDVVPNAAFNPVMQAAEDSA